MSVDWKKRRAELAPTESPPTQGGSSLTVDTLQKHMEAAGFDVTVSSWCVESLGQVSRLHGSVLRL